ncbi:MAG: hypothetical protein ACTSQI_19630 [Candidatus Helarchaeota archaeon]
MKSSDFFNLIEKLDDKEIKVLLDLIEDYIVDDNIMLEYFKHGVRIGVKKKFPQSILKELSINESEVRKSVGNFIIVFDILMNLNYSVPRFQEEVKDIQFSDEIKSKLSLLKSELLKRKTILSFITEARLGWGYKLDNIEYSIELKMIDLKKKTLFIPIPYLKLELYDLKEDKDEIIKIHLTREQFTRLSKVLKEFEDKLNETQKRIDELEEKVNE